MITFHEALGRPVIETASAQQVGAVEGFVVDEHNSLIRAIHIGGAKRSPEFVSWTDIESFGTDAVMIGEGAKVRPAADEREQRTANGELTVLSKRVLTDLGDEVSAVTDVEFDPENGQVDAFLTDTDRISSDRYLGVGSYALVVAALDEATDQT
jgi:uncharacterized protein YrrD